MDLLGKVIHHRINRMVLSCQIIETEAYYRREKGSHAYLGKTKSRKALFMNPGTIYMYYSRGGDSFNIVCRGSGNAVLIKSGIPFCKNNTDSRIGEMQKLNPLPGGRPRKPMFLCSGQTLLCKSLGIRVDAWNGKFFDPEIFYISDESYTPETILKTTRLGIPPGRDEQLMYRYIDEKYVKYCTKNPLTMRKRPPIKLLHG